MLWVIQEDLFVDKRRGDLVMALDRLGIERTSVSLSESKTLPDLGGRENDVITNGSVMLSRLAREACWSPGSLLNDNFDHAVWGPAYGTLALNHGSLSSTLGGAAIPWERAFVRPALDDKSFSGRVMDRDEFERLRAGSLAGVPGLPLPETMVLVAKPRTIGQEHRHYIVDGEPVTSSRYKLSGVPNFKEGADQAVLDFVRGAAKTFSPARAFVMDTYIAGDEIGIVEIGCICHAGLYDSDVLRLAAALDSMGPEPSSDRSFESPSDERIRPRGLLERSRTP